MSIIDKKLSFDTSKEYYNQNQELVFTDYFEITNVEDYERSIFPGDSVLITFKSRNKPFKFQEIFKVTEGGKLSILLKCIHKRRKYINVALVDLIGCEFKKTAVKKRDGFYTLFPEVLDTDKLMVEEW